MTSPEPSTPGRGVTVLQPPAAGDGATRPGRTGRPGRASRAGGLLRLARLLGGRAGRPLGTSVAAAAPVVRALGALPGVPVVAPLVEPLLRPVAPIAGALGAPLGRIVGATDGRPPRPPVALRVDRRDAAVVPDVLHRLHPATDGRLVVLVPAVGDDETSWGAGCESTGATYGDRLRDVLGWSAVPLRLDGGTPLAGLSLALGSLLQRLVEEWPVEVRRIVLVAHGDGALVARGALGVRGLAERPWTDRVTELVALDSPQLGTDRAPVTRGVGRRLDRELAGLVVVGPEVLDVPAPPHVAHLLFGDRLTTGPNPVGRLLGGLLWWRHRAPGGRPVVDLFPTGQRVALSTAHHPLVNHPEVHDALLRRLAGEW